MPKKKIVVQYWVQFGCGTVRTVSNSRRYVTHGWIVRHVSPEGRGIPLFAGFSNSETLAQKALQRAKKDLSKTFLRDPATGGLYRCECHSSEIRPVSAT